MIKSHWNICLDLSMRALKLQPEADGETQKLQARDRTEGRPYRRLTGKRRSLTVLHALHVRVEFPKVGNPKAQPAHALTVPWRCKP